MATETAPSTAAERSAANSNNREARDSVSGTLMEALFPIASLKLTVALLSFSLLLVLFGTLAQDRSGIWRVVGEYFHAAFVKVPFQIFLPTAWFPQTQSVSGGFWFPGGATISVLMTLNLLSAHLLRFKSQARGRRLAIGVALLLLGISTTYWIISRGHNAGGLQAEPPVSWSTLSAATWIGAWIAVLLTAVWGVQLQSKGRIVHAWLTWGISSALAVGLVVGQWKGWSIDAAGMRIVWQLFQSQVAALILLAGCNTLFAKRGGIVLLHAGIGLMMFGQFYVSKYDSEEQMTIVEGETTDFGQDIRCVELAIAKRQSDMDHVIAVPLLRAGHRTKWGQSEKISVDSLPFDLEVLACYEHSQLRPANSAEENLATSGNGLQVIAVNEPPSAGASSDSKVDEAAVYVKITRRDTRQEIGTFLLAQAAYRQASGFLDLQETIKDGDQEYELSLRFERNYKPYSIRLIDVKKEDYVGTSTPRNYASDIHLIDRDRNVDRPNITISMNNPLRYANETFYQSGYNVIRGHELTTLQVVRNSGWMIPYVACMIVATGMLAHFGQVLIRYLLRMTAKSPTEISPLKSTKGVPAAKDSPGVSAWRRWGIPLAVTILFLLYVGRAAQVPQSARGEMNLVGFGQLPVADHGRVKPLDTLARNCMRIISNSESFKDEKGISRPAIRWLVDVIAGVDAADKYQVFRIDNPEVLDLLKLTPRPGFFRYSIEELSPGIPKLEEQLKSVEQRKPREMTTYDKKLLQLRDRLQTYIVLRQSFRPLDFPDLPTKAEFERDPDAAAQVLERLRMRMRQVDEIDAQLERLNPPAPRVIPVDDNRHWVTYSTSWNHAYRDRILSALGAAPPDKTEPSQAVLHFATLLDSYRAGKVEEFGAELERYNTFLRRNQPSEMPRRGTSYESFVNSFSPFMHANVLFTISFVITLIGWICSPLGWLRPVRDASFWLMICTFLLHGLAIWQRMEISGRPPVTNLYSSAVFIGWACVGLSLVMEVLFKIGIGNAVGAIAGSATLWIGYFLSNDGDTISVMQAVLDTQFWLATHVVVITLGYSATFLAGLVGAIYVLAMIAEIELPVLSFSLGRIGSRQLTLGQAMTSIIYGVVCFATLASFVGTVLGGLWADDSWGRFWGWDPKENGALIIVIWNAIVLHARWDGMIKERGLAILAVGGNIVTAWSWFGVNELGIGLHSYGFTEGRLRYLAIFVVSQLAIIGLGLLLQFWLRRRSNIAAS